MRRIAWWFLRRSKTLRRLRRQLKSLVTDRPRRIPKSLGVQGFFEELDRRGCRYVVLRWFDDLPHVDSEGDLDVLVDDEHAEEMASLLTRSPTRGTVKCDVYSHSGLPGFEHRRHAYYPPHVADEILSRATRHESGAFVPSTEDYFYSLAFHALYHKGYGSGLPVSKDEGPRGASTRHDYAAELSSLAHTLGLPISIDLTSLDQALSERGWRPAPDTLMKWAAHNAWCRDLVDQIFDSTSAPAGLVVFLIREVASEAHHIEQIEGLVDRWAFDRLATLRLDREQQQRASRMIRGGNWERGPWPLSGGTPSVMIVARDPDPSVPSQALRDRHPGVDNGRIFELKANIRDAWNEPLAPEKRSNIVHASDNAAHAVHYLEIVAPELVGQILPPAAGQHEVLHD
jgi:hypothetical protein